MEIAGTIVIGLLVGIGAKLLMPKKNPDGYYHHFLLGIIARLHFRPAISVRRS